MAPTNMIQLDQYYNSLQDSHHELYDTVKDTNQRKYSAVSDKSKTFGQSLKDLFFPDDKSNRRIIRVKKKQLGSFSTTQKPYFTTVSTRSPSRYSQERDKISSESFPYFFQKPIEAPISRYEIFLCFL